MLKKLLLAAQFLLAAFLVKFFDADGLDIFVSSSEDADSAASSSEGSDSAISSSEGSDDAMSALESGELVSSSLNTSPSSEDVDSSNNSSPSSERRPKGVPDPDLLQKLSPQDLSQIPRRDGWPDA